MLWCAGHRIVPRRRRCSTVNSVFVDGCSLFVLLCHASSLAEDDAMVCWSSHRPETETMLDRESSSRNTVFLCHASSLAEDDAMVCWSSHRPEAETMLDS